MCVLNGRVQGLDNFTCISTKGTSVVDYILVPHENVNDCMVFNVIPCTELIDREGLHGLLSEDSKMPDHSILSIMINMGLGIVPIESESNDDEVGTSFRRPRYSRKRLNEQFMQSDMARTALLKVIENIECNREMLLTF